MNQYLITGSIGCLSACIVGIGEFLLHYASSGYGEKNPYQFMLQLSKTRLTFGHFIAVLAAPFYLIGFWHIYLMLSPAGGFLPILTMMITVYGFIMGIIWIGSRATIASIAQLQFHSNSLSFDELIKRYQLFNESLLMIIRVSTLLMAAGYSYLVYQGHTFYPSWMWIINPFFLLISIFLLYFILPRIGRYIMPIAMNVAYFIFFIFSTWAASNLP